MRRELQIANTTLLLFQNLMTFLVNMYISSWKELNGPEGFPQRIDYSSGLYVKFAACSERLHKERGFQFDYLQFVRKFRELIKSRRNHFRRKSRQPVREVR